MLWKIIVAAVVSVIILIVVIVKLKKRKARIRAIRTRAEDKRREEELNRLILNPNVSITNPHPEKPYDVHYGVSEEGKTPAKKKHWMLQIEVHTEITVRSYMLDPAKPITIGSGKENTVVLPGGRHEARICMLEMHGGKIYLARISVSEEITVERGKKRTGIHNKKLEIHSGDTILIGNDYLKLTMVDKKI